MERLSKRPWTRRTKELIPAIPSDIYTPEIITEIKQKGEDPITPYAALTRFGYGIDETQIPYLNSLLVEIDHQFFIKGQAETSFKSRDIEQFIQIITSGNIPFMILECSTLTTSEKEAILRGAPAFLTRTALEKREKDWQR